MQLSNAKEIVEHLEGEGENAYVMKDYSGRGMFGSKTAAVIADDASDVLIAMGTLGIKDSKRQDSMGLGVVIY